MDHQLTTIPRSISENEEKTIWKDVFDHLAHNDGIDDGKIDREALIKWISAMDMEKRLHFEKHLNLSPKQIKDLVIKADVNKDGFIDKQEFLNLVQNKTQIMSKLQQKLIRQYFQVRTKNKRCIFDF